MLINMQQNFFARKHLELSLSQKWWERHLRGFEAQLPTNLMKNLYELFKGKQNDPLVVDKFNTSTFAIMSNDE